MTEYYTDIKNHTHAVTHICLPAADAAGKAQILASIRQVMEKMRERQSGNTN